MDNPNYSPFCLPWNVSIFFSLVVTFSLLFIIWYDHLDFFFISWRFGHTATVHLDMIICLCDHNDLFRDRCMLVQWINVTHVYIVNKTISSVCCECDQYSEQKNSINASYYYLIYLIPINCFPSSTETFASYHLIS